MIRRPSTLPPIISASGAYYAAHALLILAGLISMPIMTRLLSKAEYGLLGLLYATVSVFAVIGGMGFGEAAVRLYSEQRERGAAAERDLCNTLIGGSLVAGGITALIVSAAALWIDSSHYVECLPLASLLVIIRAVSGVLFQIYRAQERAGAHAVTQIFQRYGTMVLAIGFLLLFRRNAQTVIAAAIMIELAAVAARWIDLARRGTTSVPALARPVLTAAAAYGLPLALAGAARFLLDYSDRFLIERLLGLDAVAIYSVPNDVTIRMGEALWAPIQLAALPIMFRVWESDGPQATSRFASDILSYMIAIMVPIATLFLIHSEEIIVLLASAKYEGAGQLVPYLLPGVLLGSINSIVAVALTVQKRTAIVALIVFGAALFNVALNLLRTPHLHPPGREQTALWLHLWGSGRLELAPFEVLTLDTPEILPARAAGVGPVARGDSLGWIDGNPVQEPVNRVIVFASRISYPPGLGWRLASRRPPSDSARDSVTTTDQTCPRCCTLLRVPPRYPLMKTHVAQERLQYVFGALLCALLGSNLVHGQVAPAPASTGPELKTPSKTEVSAGRTGLASAAADEPIELSPFVIMAEEDKGYQATSSLSGTRLRTDLRDIAASVSVITKELMEDLAADDLSLLAAYTVGTEVGGLNGNFSDTDVFNETGGYVNDEPTRRNNSTPVIRVRGLGGGNGGGANRTRDYFLTNIPGDSYNIDRIDFQRGPNGMLYGLGSPSGVVNESVIRARLQKNRTKISTRFDDFGSYRGSIDHNQVLKKDKVAFRFAALYNRQEYQIKEAFELNRRIYGTVTYKPFSGTTLRVSGEGADLEGNPPRTMAPYDAYSYWWSVGRPVYNANTGVASYLGTAPTDPNLSGATRFLASGQHRGNLPSLIVQNAATGAYGLGIAGNPQAAELVGTRVRRNPANTAWVNDGVYGLANGRNYVQQVMAPNASDPTRPYWRFLQITDPAIFDFYHHQLDGDARSRNARWNTFNVALEQRLGPNAGLEVAYDRQHHDTSFSDWAQFGNYTLKLDVTTTLIDGQPNPNYGRPFMADAMPRAARNNSLEAFRATAFYDFDFKRVFRPDGLLAKILGRHTLTTNFTRQTNEVVYFYGTPMADLDYWAVKQAANAGTATVASKLSTGPRNLNLIAYVGPSVIGQAGPQNLGLQPVMGSVIDNIPNRMSLYYYPTPPANTTVPATWTTRSFGVVNPSDEYYMASIGSQATHTREVFKGIAAVMQSRWLSDTLVSTLGLRRDWVRTFDAGGPIFDDATGVPFTDESIYYPQPRINERHDAFNYGLVAHMPGFVQRRLPKSIDVSLTYGRSDNFTPQAERFNVYGQSMNPTAGSTQEYGAFVSLFNRKIQLRLTHYETASTSATAASFTNNPILNLDRTMYTLLTQMEQGRIEYLTDRVTPSATAKAALLNFLRKPEAASFYSTDVAGYYIDANGRLQGSGDRTINRVFATTDIVGKGWEFDVTANPTRSWRVSFNVAKQDTIRTNSGGDLAAMLESWRPFLVDGAAGDLPITEGSNTSLRTQYLSTWMSTLNRVRALDGSRSPELREWRFNFINSYSFNEGRLKGWSVGGALRWQDKSAIGYPIIVIGGSGQYDVKNPYWGPTTTNVDGWIGYGRRVWRDRIAWKSQLNIRNIGVRDRLIPMTAAPDESIDNYRISAGMTFALTNSFEF